MQRHSRRLEWEARTAAPSSGALIGPQAAAAPAGGHLFWGWQVAPARPARRTWKTRPFRPLAPAPASPTPGAERYTCENIPALTASDWSIVRIYPRLPHLIGPFSGWSRLNTLSSSSYAMGYSVDVKGYSVDVKGYFVDVKGCSVDVVKRCAPTGGRLLSRRLYSRAEQARTIGSRITWAKVGYLEQVVLLARVQVGQALAQHRQHRPIPARLVHSLNIYRTAPNTHRIALNIQHRPIRRRLSRQSRGRVPAPI
eukprot:4845297-Pyramimonas_sp.AAC.1